MHNFLHNNKFNIALRQAQGPYESAHGVRGKTTFCIPNNLYYLCISKQMGAPRPKL